MGMQKAGPRALKSLEHKAKALELRRAGLTYDQIGKQLGLVKVHAWRLVQAALISTLQEPADAVRALEVERLDALWVKWFPRAQKHDKDAAGVCLKIMERRARLLGLDAPVTLQGPDGAPVRFVVEVPVPAPSVEAWQAQAAAVIDATPRPELGMEVISAEQP
jgi:hypothetical protein